MPSFALTLPIGIGLKLMIGDNISLFAEADHRITNQEYLDGFSITPTPKRKMPVQPLPQALFSGVHILVKAGKTPDEEPYLPVNVDSHPLFALISFVFLHAFKNNS